jgi:hypothetical protein
MQIEGWFEEIELDLLIECMEQVAFKSRHYSDLLNVVEIGSYKGRSTIALGLAVSTLHLDAVIYAVDPHGGLRSGRNNSIYHENETYDDFLQNVRRYGLESVIKCVKCKSTESMLEVPISLILIDGLHLYENVREDFLHFEKKIIAGGLVLFHDYSDKFPDVFRFVNSLLNTKKPPYYLKVDQAHSLAVLKKVC